MSDLSIEVLEIKKEIAGISQLLNKIRSEILAQKIAKNWANEVVVAIALGYKTPRSFRKLATAKDRNYPFTLIRYRTTNGKNYQYNIRSIEEFMDATSK